MCSRNRPGAGAALGTLPRGHSPRAPPSTSRGALTAPSRAPPCGALTAPTSAPCGALTAPPSAPCGALVMQRRKVNVDNLGIVFLAELVGTAMLVLLGCGVVANVALARTKGYNGGFLMVNFGWGIAVFAGVTVAYASGAQLNPAVTLGLVANGATEFGNPAFGTGVPVGVVSVLTYIGAQLLGAFLGAVVAWLAYRQHFDAEPEPANKLGVFSTGPAMRSYGWNLVTEIIG